MAVRFYMDQHVPRAVTEGLMRRSVEVLRVQDDGHDRAPDDVILDRAAALGRIVFTRDADFLVEAQHRQANDIPFAGVVFAHQLGPSIGQCVRDLEIIAVVYELSDMESRVEYLPL
jgi:hypothetical protein